MSIYLDNASSVPVLDENLKLINDTLLNWYNPNGLYNKSLNNRKIIEDMRKDILLSIGGNVEDKLIFTSSGSEANNMALDVLNYAIVYDPTSHSSVIDKCEYYHNKGFPVYPLSVLDTGAIGLMDMYDKLCKAAWNKNNMKPRNVIVSICGGNNENGHIQDLEEIINIIGTVKKHIQYATKEEFNIYLHVDAVQLIVQEKVNVCKKHIDMMTLSGHKIGSPYGIGLLYIKKGIDISPIIFGEQEYGLRGGTENLPYIASLYNSIKSINYDNIKYIDKLQKYMFVLLSMIDCCHIVGSINDRLSNNVSCLFKGYDGESIVNYLDLYGIQCSTGSACNSYKRIPSHVLKAMGYKDEECLSQVRFTIGSETRIEDIEYTVKIIKQFIASEEGGACIA